MTVAVRRTSVTGRVLRTALPAVIVAVALSIPFTSSPFRVYQLTIVIVWAIAALGLNLLTGWAGQMSIGHSAFFAFGAYTTGILVQTHDWPHLLTLLPALLGGFVFGVVIGVPSLRLKGLYLAMVSIALAMMVIPVLTRFASITGGHEGLALPKLGAPASTSLDDDQWIYLVFLGIAVCGFALAAAITQGRVGRGLTAIRDNETAAASVGIHVPRYKILIFGVSAAYTSVAGGMYAIVVEFISPPSFSLFLSIYLLTAIVVGGLGSLSGAVLGALFIHYAPLFASSIDEQSGSLVYGAILIVVMVFAPGGAMSLLVRSVSRFVRLTEVGPAMPGPQAHRRSEPTIEPTDDSRAEPAALAQRRYP